VLISEKALADYFEATVAAAKSPTHTIANWIIGDLLRLLNDRGLSVENSNLPPAQLAELIDLTTDKVITQSTAQELLPELFDSGQNPRTLVEKRGLNKITNEQVLAEIVDQIIARNPDPVASYLSGKEAIFTWLMGQVARATQGKADPLVSSRLLSEALRGMKKDQK
jgi:aspartyl-tRNA(Asn)/glutamyl-tRNA(Gln) amidotransferase subunit B